MSPQSSQHGYVLLALGANCPGAWGNPEQTFAYALRTLEAASVKIKARSAFYETAAIGQPHQPPYLNAVVLVATSMPPAALLRLLKQIETRAGRRSRGPPWGPRPLDLDIVDYKGLVRTWRAGSGRPANAARSPLIVPHPHVQERPFVLRPLLDVTPNWRHPALHVSGKELLRRVARKKEGRVLKRLRGA
jgi:2-amino-4-hydroxy-6-hydroxymethyldihydropteridine diphosphokinase